MADHPRRLAWIAAACVAVALGTLDAQTPSLAELAKREEARRKALQGTSKILTNKDLPPVQGPPQGESGGTGSTPGPPSGGSATAASAGTMGGQAAPGSAPAAGAAPAPLAQGAQAEDPKKDEQYWRQRITEARQQLARQEILLAALESRVNALMTDFVNRDDPAQKAVIARDRQKALDELNRTRAEIERLKRAIAEIEEEARKAGVPPGWLR
jgi:hypothetical protein